MQREIEPRTSRAGAARQKRASAVNRRRPGVGRAGIGGESWVETGIAGLRDGRQAAPAAIIAMKQILYEASENQMKLLFAMKYQRVGHEVDLSRAPCVRARPERDSLRRFFQFFAVDGQRAVACGHA
ncbi:MAG: hypothetical protein FJX37_07850, partial [Alphaproteobacteria bacterium]|nr:hypothetical protein [Alphaproteobacteria bacterium]